MSLLVAGFCAHAADVPAEAGAPATPARPKPLSLWKISAATLLASNVLDAGSSWGKRELNPVLSGSTGSFGGKSALLKLGVEAGVVTLEYLVLRHRASRLSIKALTWINFGDASATTAMAVRNFEIAGR